MSIYKRILVGFKDTDQGHDALALGRVLAKASGAEMLVESAPSKDGEGLAEIARSREADLVVLGSTHRSPVGRVIPGATVEHLLGKAPCAVAIAPPGFARSAEGTFGWYPLSGDGDDLGLRVIGVGFDASPASREALQIAAALALENGAALRVYAVARKYPHVPGADGDARGPGVPSEAEALRLQLHQAVAELPPQTRALPVFRRGFPADELIEAVSVGVDLLILGSRSGGPVRRLLHTSISSIVMRDAGCPVLISPSGVKMPSPALV